MNDPIRFSDGGAGRAEADLVAALAPPPPLPPRVRSEVASRVGASGRRALSPRPTLGVAAAASLAVALAVAAVIGLASSYPSDPEPEAPTSDIAPAPEVSEPAPELSPPEPTPAPAATTPAARAPVQEPDTTREPVPVPRSARETRSRYRAAEKVAPTRSEQVPPAAEERGTLIINTMPWSRVFIDGVDTQRNTPIRHLRLPVGVHRIGLRTADGTMHDLSVTIRAGETVRVVRRL